jgi:putative FmdB family regulatory protein
VPVYEYVCTACGHPVEVMHSFTSPGPQACERCSAPMRKALSTPAIVFKGSGWAKKDHRDKIHAARSSGSAKVTQDGAAAATATTGDSTGGTTPAPATGSGDAAPSAAPSATAAAAAAPTVTQGTRTGAA